LDCYEIRLALVIDEEAPSSLLALPTGSFKVTKDIAGPPKKIVVHKTTTFSDILKNCGAEKAEPKGKPKINFGARQKETTENSKSGISN
jgi:hypothetical protein